MKLQGQMKLPNETARLYETTRWSDETVRSDEITRWSYKTASSDEIAKWSDETAKWSDETARSDETAKSSYETARPDKTAGRLDKSAGRPDETAGWSDGAVSLALYEANSRWLPLLLISLKCFAVFRKLQALVYDILWRKVPETCAECVSAPHSEHRFPASSCA